MLEATDTSNAVRLLRVGGESGVDMERNIFQSDAPVAVIQSVRAVVHNSLEPERALDLHPSLKRQLATQRAG